MHILPFLDLAHLPQSPETTYNSIFFDSVLNPALPRIETRENKAAHASRSRCELIFYF